MGRCVWDRNGSGGSYGIGGGSPGGGGCIGAFTARQYFYYFFANEVLCFWRPQSYKMPAQL